MLWCTGHPPSCDGRPPVIAPAAARPTLLPALACSPTARSQQHYCAMGCSPPHSLLSRDTASPLIFSCYYCVRRANWRTVHRNAVAVAVGAISGQMFQRCRCSYNTHHGCIVQPYSSSHSVVTSCYYIELTCRGSLDVLLLHSKLVMIFTIRITHCYVVQAQVASKPYK